MNIKQIIKEELENILREEELEEITIVPQDDDLSKIGKKCDELDRLEDLAFDAADKLKNGEPDVAVVVKRIAERINVISNEIRVLVGRHRNRMRQSGRARDYRRRHQSTGRW